MSDFNLYAKGILNQFPLYSVAHVTTGGITVATATVTIGGAYVGKSGYCGGAYAAYLDLWERLNSGQKGLFPSLTTLEIAALTGIDDGVVVINKTTGRMLTCINGKFQNPAGEQGGIINRAKSNVTTTDNSQAVLESITLGEGDVYLFTTRIVAEKPVNLVVAAFVIECTAERPVGGSAVIQGGTTFTHTGKGPGAASWSVEFTVSGNDLQVSVKGQNGSTVQWESSTNYLKF